MIINISIKEFIQYMESSNPSKMDVKIASSGTNMIGYYRECQEPQCTRLVPCPHIRCQDHRTDMVIKRLDSNTC